MPVEVQGPDGNTYQFPDGTDKTAAIAYFKKKGIGGKAAPQSEVSNAAERSAGLPDLHVGVNPHPRKLPKEGSVEQRFGPGPGGYIEAGRQGAEKWMTRNAPVVMGTIGGIVGGVPGAIIGGAAAGTAEDTEHPLTGAVKESLTQGAYELGGKLVSKAAGRFLKPVGERLAPRIAPYLEKYPILKGLLGITEKQAAPRAAQHLTAAASEKSAAGQVVEEIGHTIEDIEQELTKVPEKDRTVKGFLNAVNSRKSAMNLEKESALKPVAGVKVSPSEVAKRIRALTRPYMTQTAEGKAQAKAIESAAKNFDKDWTFGQLDTLRTDLGSQLSRHKAKGSVAKYVAEKGDLALSIDNAILDGLRETVYPEMDRVAGKESGYFEQLTARQSSLIQLQQVLEKRVKDLRGSQAVGEATGRFSKENFSLYARPGGMPRTYIHGLKESILPTREYTEASKHVAKAFPGPKVNEQPYRVLFGTAGRVFGPDPRRNPTDEYSDPAQLQ